VDFVVCPYNRRVPEQGNTNEDWRLADKVAAFLRVDRDVRRRAFYREPEHRVRGVVRWVLRHRGLADHNRERMIEGWVRRSRPALRGESRRSGDLEHDGELAVRVAFGRDAVA
jgi:hypothetical protein